MWKNSYVAQWWWISERISARYMTYKCIYYAHTHMKTWLLRIIISISIHKIYERKRYLNDHKVLSSCFIWVSPETVDIRICTISHHIPILLTQCLICVLLSCKLAGPDVKIGHSGPPKLKSSSSRAIKVFSGVLQLVTSQKIVRSQKDISNLWNPL